MRGATRYLRLLAAFARYGLARELTFRGNFLVKVLVEVLWLGILLVFYRTVFAKTSVVAGWSEPEYLFFVGCYFALEGIIETLFLENCNEFADLVRTGDLDFILLKPIDEQFLVSCRWIEWSTAPNVLMGAAVMGIALHDLQWTFDLVQVLLFVGMFACGVGIAYSFMLLLTSASVWLVRNQSLYELWWLFTSLVRYPKEIYQGKWASPMGWFFTFVVPILLVVNVPARTMVKSLDPAFLAFMAGTALVLLLVSRRLFQYALRRYRSASS
jgi:ABC-2 type transport system permease protein